MPLRCDLRRDGGRGEPQRHAEELGQAGEDEGSCSRHSCSLVTRRRGGAEKIKISPSAGLPVSASPRLRVKPFPVTSKPPSTSSSSTSRGGTSGRWSRGGGR